MRKALETLIQLQIIDTQLMHLEEEKGDLPQKVKVYENQVSDMQKDLENTKTEYEEKKTRKFNVDNELSLLGEKLKKYQAQLYQVKTNKEYDAITVEIENTQELIDKLEIEFLELEDLEKKIEQQVAEKQEEVEKLEKELLVFKKELDEKLAATREEEGGLTKEREKVSSGLTKQMLSTYERIRNGRSGLAVSFLEAGACSACSSRVPPQRGLEIRMMDSLHLCEVCGRILVWKEEKQPTQKEADVS